MNDDQAFCRWCGKALVSAGVPFVLHDTEEYGPGVPRQWRWETQAGDCGCDYNTRRSNPEQIPQGRRGPHEPAPPVSTRELLAKLGVLDEGV